jgi:hypothetical protein
MGYIKDLAREYYESKPKKDMTHKYVSPSMLGGCPRVAWFKANGFEESTPPDTNALMNFEVGNLWEAKISEILDETEKLIYWWNEGQSERMKQDPTKWKAELRQDAWIDEELMVRGTPDQFIKDGDNYCLLDTKTMKDDASKYIVNLTNEQYFNEKAVGYKLQLGCYLILCKRRFEKGLEKYLPKYGKLVIISKDNGHVIKEPTLVLTPELEQEVLERIEYMRKAIQSESPPPCTCEGWQIEYSNFGTLSSMEPNKKKKVVPTRCCEVHEVINFSEHNKSIASKMDNLKDLIK